MEAPLYLCDMFGQRASKGRFKAMPLPMGLLPPTHCQWAFLLHAMRLFGIRGDLTVA
jgi:hypothetical protein